MALTEEGAKLAVDELKRIGDQIEELAERRTQFTDMLEREAKIYLRAANRFTRSYQGANIVFDDDGSTTAFDDDGVTFYVTNGIDKHDDFHVHLTWEQLAADPEEVTKMVDAAEHKRRLKAARQKLAIAQADLDRLAKRKT
jgi:hypothetical protein